MTRISNVDQVLMLLRQQLQRMSGPDRSRKSATSSAAAQKRETAARRIEAVTRHDDLGDEDLGRTLLGALLVDEFGEAAANDHKFQKLVDEVYRIIANDAQARALLDSAVKEVRKAAA